MSKSDKNYYICMKGLKRLLVKYEKYGTLSVNFQILLGKTGARLKAGVYLRKWRVCIKKRKFSIFSNAPLAQRITGINVTSFCSTSYYSNLS